MCNCKNINLGNILDRQQTELWYPDWFKSERTNRACFVDNCIVDEIQFLWSNAIQTIESCCGHNQVSGYIAVVDDAIPKMVALGYLNYQNPLYPERKDEFIPKTI